jgi:recombination protein RecR
MFDLPDSIKEAITQLSRIPGVGEKTATRQVLALLNWRAEEIKDFSQSFDDLLNIQKCESCGMYADEKICSICSSEERVSQGTICVVENITDALAIEKSDNYQGTYHILGGVLNPLLGIGPNELNLDLLVKRIESHNVKNIILAINPSVEGDATCSYIRQIVSQDIVIDRIGFGIPVGGSLEYLDGLTISKALENRKQM